MSYVSLQVDWKLTRGKWRPKLLDYAKDALEQSVVDATKSAYASLRTSASPELQHVEEALKELTSLKVSKLQSIQDTISTLANADQCQIHVPGICGLVNRFISDHTCHTDAAMGPIIMFKLARRRWSHGLHVVCL